ncbi:lysophospholipid acyltransferase family protein [Marinobacter zhejiangensis]|uniref:1-acyl-sn-glycerol-3-phosphate acyltransferase n=1 Tax=Marinobacter zhejiangensis TaxID=488535 RepID=A0A1I4N7Q4_9GAMM|nr:lysophospholipid acyltransferase family protein [Marinobacter zhejiangensis]SFM11518.1 1-acyl-sn-glycerol-3-phosphate acyltransferase [Marinobacter zhejiangensis]
MKDYARLTYRLTLFTLSLSLTIGIACSVTLVEWLGRRRIDRTPYARFCFHGAVRSLGFRVRQQGDISAKPVLYLSNHISWSDIPILGGQSPLRFLSKAEVGKWPVIGWLAGQAGTLFIKRGGGKSQLCRQEIATTLEKGQSVLIFPEGTTTSGITVLPFHSRLLWAAKDAGVDIQPISIGYLRDGQPDHLAPFIGDDEFQGHLLRMLKSPSVDVGVIFHPTVTINEHTDLDALALELHETVTSGLKRIHRAGDQSETANADALPVRQPN